MKRILACFCIALVFFSCKKKNQSDVHIEYGTYTIEGNLIYLYNESPDPASYTRIAMTTKDMVYQANDASTVTDENGYFKITYTQSSNNKAGLCLYLVPPNYDCIGWDISIIKNLPNGQNLNLGILYIKQ